MHCSKIYKTCPNGGISVQSEVIYITTCIKIDLGQLETDYIKWKLDNSENTQVTLWEGQR